MKIRVDILLIVALLVGSLVGCQKELRPRGAISQEDALRTEIDAKMWSNKMLSSLRYLHGGAFYLTGAEIQGGMLSAMKTFGNRYGEILRNEFTASTEVMNEFYWNHYNVIKETNFVLDNIDNVKVANEENAYLVPLLKGQAYFMRAFCYERLISRFARTEDPSKPGVVLLVHYDMTKRHEKRASQEAVFKQIYDDLAKAADCFKTVYRQSGIPAAQEITPDCVTALRARAALTQLNYAEALKNAEALIKSGIYHLATNADDLAQMWHEDVDRAGELIMQSYCRFGSEDPNTVPQILYYNERAQAFINDYYPTQDAIDLFPTGDFRKKIYFTVGNVFLGDAIKQGILVFKYPGATSLREIESVPNGANCPKPFRIAEQYLIAAESAFKSGDEVKAKLYLNQLRMARGLSEVMSGGDALWKEIKDERTRELAFEGFRIVDMRRWGDPIVKQQIQKTSIADKLLESTIVEIKASAPQFVWPIPAADQNLAGLEQNPGY